MPRWIVPVLAALLAIGAALPAGAQWKWRDARGQTQYSDLPPPLGTPEANILQRPSPSGTARRAPAASAAASSASGASAAAAPLLAPKASDPELEARRKKAEQDVADKKKADDTKAAAAKLENCNRAKTQMRTFDSGLRVSRVNEKGEREYLDDAAREAETRRTRDIIAADCS